VLAPLLLVSVHWPSVTVPRGFFVLSAKGQIEQAGVMALVLPPLEAKTALVKTGLALAEYLPWEVEYLLWEAEYLVPMRVVLALVFREEACQLLPLSSGICPCHKA
jgi:hypothetical protein